MRPLALWATPRTVSTAFDMMMRTRGDHTVLTEPFSVAWYLGPEQRSRRFEVTEPAATFAAVLDDVLAAASSGPVFVKDMAYQLGPLLRQDVLQHFTGTFLVRDPAWTLPSMARVWPDFTEDEAGYRAQHAAWTTLRAAGENPVVIDGADLLLDPPAVVSEWCRSVGIETRLDALSWAPTMPDDWARWSEWFASASTSSGFRPPRSGPPPEVSGELQRRIDACRPFYEELAAHRLGA